jgi:hypothetical protein
MSPVQRSKPLPLATRDLPLAAFSPQPQPRGLRHALRAAKRWHGADRVVETSTWAAAGPQTQDVYMRATAQTRQAVERARRGTTLQPQQRRRLDAMGDCYQRIQEAFFWPLRPPGSTPQATPPTGPSAGLEMTDEELLDCVDAPVDAAVRVYRESGEVSDQTLAMGILTENPAGGYLELEQVAAHPAAVTRDQPWPLHAGGEILGVAVALSVAAGYGGEVRLTSREDAFPWYTAYGFESVHGLRLRITPQRAGAHFT